MAARRRGIGDALQWHEHAEVGDGEAVGECGRVDRAEVPDLRGPVVIEVAHVEAAADDPLRLGPVGVAKAGSAVLLVDRDGHHGVGRHLQHRRRQVADPVGMGIVRPRECDRVLHRRHGFEVDGDAVTNRRRLRGERRRKVKDEADEKTCQQREDHRQCQHDDGQAPADSWSLLGYHYGRNISVRRILVNGQICAQLPEFSCDSGA